MNMKPQIAALMLCSSLAMPAVFAEDVTPRTQLSDAAKAAAEQVMPIRASQFIGMNIYNLDNASVGEVKDIVFDGGHTQISYVAVTYGGLMGIGDKLYAVPYQAFKYRPVDSGKLTLDISKDIVKNMQGFDEKNWPDLNDPTIRKSMMELYHVNATDAKADAKAMDKSVNTDQARKELEKTAETPMKDGLVWTRRYSSLKGANIVNKADEKLGDVYDIVFDARNGHVNYVVLQHGGLMGIGDKLFAVPVQAIASKSGEQKLVVDISPDRLKNAPGFDQSKWPDFADPTLRNSYDTYYKTDQSTSTVIEQK